MISINLDEFAFRFEFQLNGQVISLDPFETVVKLTQVNDTTDPEKLPGLLEPVFGVKASPTQCLILLDAFRQYMDANGEAIKKALDRTQSSDTTTVSSPPPSESSTQPLEGAETSTSSSPA